MSVSQVKPVISFEKDALLVERLLKDLQAEQAALIVSNMDAMEKLVDSRLVLLQQLSLAAKLRYDALTAHGYQANEQGMTLWVQAQNQTGLKDAWLNFQRSLIQAKEMNRLNGILISKQFNRNQQVLDQLQGNNQKNEIYGKNGQSHTQSYLRNALSV
jgi:flagellar biosynthesis protein FlgN